MLNGGLLNGNGKVLGLNCSKRREPNAKSRTQEQARRLPPVGKTQCCAPHGGQRSTSCDRGRAERPSQVAQKSANPVQETKAAPTGEVALIPVWKLSQKDEKESSGKCRVCRALRQQVAEDRLEQESATSQVRDVQANLRLRQQRTIGA